jgi:DNA-binding LytR/AlgR family response regulator
MKDGQERLVPRTIKFYEAYLETHGFLRVHRGFMINPMYVKQYDSEQELLMMSNGQVANISRRRKGVLKDFVE